MFGESRGYTPSSERGGRKAEKDSEGVLAKLRKKAGREVASVMVGLSVAAAGVNAEAHPDSGIEHTQSAVETRQERIKKFNEWASELNSPGLSIGEPKRLLRTPAEQIGVFVKGKHIGDLVSSGGLKFDKKFFYTEVSWLLHLGADGETEMPVDIPEDVNVIMKKTGVNVEGKVMKFKKDPKIEIDLADSGRNARVELKKDPRSSVDFIIVTHEKDGTIKECTVRNGLIDLQSEKVR